MGMTKIVFGKKACDKLNAMPQQDYTDIVNMENDWQDFVHNDRKYIPLEYFERVIDGEHPVKVYREWRGYTAKELAEKIGVTPDFVSNIENRLKKGTLEMYQKIAEALDLRLEDVAPARTTEN